jgi:ergothioneine biosynthesis protein EgtB
MTSQHYNQVRSFTEELCQPLHVEDYVPQPVEFVSPPKWHLAHTTWFFEEMILRKFVPSYSVFNKDFAFLFNSYYQSLGKRAIRNQRGIMTRPTVEEVYAYRKHVDNHMTALLEENNSEELFALVELGLNHEQQHQELLITDLKFTLSLNPINPVYHPNFSLVNNENQEEGWVKVPAGTYVIGHDGDGFSFDNELPRHMTYIQEFEISKSLVTNGEYMEFMEAGGYDKFEYWLDEGWYWLQDHGIESPLYWFKQNGEWYHYTLKGLCKVNPDEILSHISFYEANAFAAWKGCKLPTEFEWEVANELFDWGERWEWTNSAYLPYPKFKIAEGAVGEYNGKFMVGQMVLKGASTATPNGHERATYRNFFHPKYRWQVTGIRLAKLL